MFTDLDRLKSQVLDDSPHLHTISIAFSWAMKITSDPVKQKGLASRAILELLDADLIYCFYATEENGYTRRDDFEPASRDEVISELSADDWIRPDGKLLWIHETNRGLTFLDELPAEAFIEPPPPHVLGDRRTHRHS